MVNSSLQRVRCDSRIRGGSAKTAAATADIVKAREEKPKGHELERRAGFDKPEEIKRDAEFGDGCFFFHPVWPIRTRHGPDN